MSFQTQTEANVNTEVEITCPNFSTNLLICSENIAGVIGIGPVTGAATTKAAVPLTDNGPMKINVTGVASVFLQKISGLDADTYMLWEIGPLS